MPSGPDKREDEATSWLWAGCWLLFIYVTIPLARSIQEFVRDHGGKWLFLAATLSVFLLAAAALVRAVRGGRLHCRPSGMLLLGIILGVFVSMSWSLRANPEESLHFVQYGLLSLLLYRALSHRFRDPSVYLLAGMIGMFFGILDELIQWVVPRRFFDYRDIGINILAVWLVQAAIALGVRPPSILPPLRRTGVRSALAVASLNLLLILFCVANDDGFKAWYSRWIPAVAQIDEATASYGYRIHDPEIGTFYSRLSPDHLREQDRTRAAEVAPILDRYKQERLYGYFLAIYPAHEDPFLVEARVHLFRRDRNASLAIHHVEDADTMMEHALVAYRENQILRSYFGKTLEASAYSWEPHLEAAVKNMIGNPPPYDSPVSRHVITSFNRRQLILMVASGFVVIAILFRWVGRRLPT